MSLISSLAPVMACRTDLRRTFDELMDLQGGAIDLPWADWVSLAALLHDFRPDLVLELGRGWGNSTALFGLFANKLSYQVVSVCRNSEWRTTTAPRLGSLMPDFAPHAIEGEIADQNYAHLLADARRVLVFWDCHGYDVADIVLSKIAPLLAARANLIICHDMRDVRYFADHRNYEDKALWRSQDEPDSLWLHLGDMCSTFEQIVSITDFVSRNDIALYSPTHDLKTRLTGELAALDTDGVCYWHSLSIPADCVNFPAPRR